jgi:hypothetical protein
MAPKKPPQFVPTLTDVVVQGMSVPPAESLSHEQLVHRVMQRVDLVLDRRLREAIAEVVLEHSRDLGPALRERIEAVVSSAVADALAEELPVPQHKAAG